MRCPSVSWLTSGPPDHDEIRRQGLELRHQARGLLDIPDVDAKPEDPRILGQQPFRNLLGLLPDHELADDAAFAQFAQVRAQAAQPERGMRIAGIEGGEHDVGHGLIFPRPAYRAPSAKRK
jgi:hypothetical protein